MLNELPLEGRTVAIKGSSNVKVGDVLATGEGEAKPLVAPFDGVVEIAEDTLVIAANASAPVRYEVPGNMQLVIKSGRPSLKLVIV
jgi:hypothetical protein